jgi:hypothetical protein
MVYELTDPMDCRTIEFLEDLILQLKRGHLSCKHLYKETTPSVTERIKGPNGEMRPLITQLDIKLKFALPFRPKAHHP